MEDWLINYYEQTDPLKRQQMLLENKNETMSEEDKLRMKLWETRYGKVSQGRICLLVIL